MSAPQPEGKTVLVIDDDPTVCSFFKTLLEKDGFDVQIAPSGREAVSLVKKARPERYNLLVLDLMMPGYGGFEVLKELQDPEFKHIPIFIVTARTLDEGTVQLIRGESNVAGFWTKPVDTLLFKSKVHEILGTLPQSKLF